MYVGGWSQRKAGKWNVFLFLKLVALVVRLRLNDWILLCFSVFLVDSRRWYYESSSVDHSETSQTPNGLLGATTHSSYSTKRKALLFFLQIQSTFGSPRGRLLVQSLSEILDCPTDYEDSAWRCRMPRGKNPILSLRSHHNLRRF